MSASNDELKRIRAYRQEVSAAAREGDVQRVSSVLERSGVDVNFMNPELPSSFDPVPPPLFAACETGQLSVVRVLLKYKNIQVNIIHDGTTPLSVAAGQGYIEIMKLFILEHGANVNFEDGRLGVKSPLFCAANNRQYEAALFLLKNGADVNYNSLYSPMTPLVAAAKNGDDKMVTLLVSNGADVNKGGMLSSPPLHYACESGYTECARILIQHGANVDSGYRTPLTSAAGNGHTQCVQLLLENGARVYGSDWPENVPLIEASKNGQLSVVQLLLNYSADVNKTTTEVYIHVHSTIKQDKHTALYFARRKGHHEIVKLLIKHGAKDLDIVESTESSVKESEDEEDAKHLAAVELAIKKKGKLDHSLSHGVLVGPARSGKSSLIKLLTGEMPSSTSPSTGVAEQVIQVGVKKSHSITLGVRNSIWFKLLYDDEAIRLMLLASHACSQPQQEAALFQNESSFPQKYSQTEINTEKLSRIPPAFRTPKKYTADLPTGYVAPMGVFKAALQHKGLEGLRQHLENSWSLYLTDTGGQIEFQELLPLLVSGPSCSLLLSVFTKTSTSDSR